MRRIRAFRHRDSEGKYTAKLMKPRMDVNTGEDLNKLPAAVQSFEDDWRARAAGTLNFQHRGKDVMSKLRKQSKQKLKGNRKIGMESVHEKSASLRLDQLKGKEFSRQIRMSMVGQMTRFNTLFAQRMSMGTSAKCAQKGAVKSTANMDGTGITDQEIMAKHMMFLESDCTDGSAFAVSMKPENKLKVMATWREIIARQKAGNMSEESGERAIKRIMAMLK